MRHLIDPMVDCVFKAIFGNPIHAHLLVSLLNAVLALARPIVAVQILNPYHEKDFEADKLTVVDVRARDADGATFHVEVQVVSHAALAERMLYLWAEQYQEQLREGDRWGRLRPVRSIWILRGRLPRLTRSWWHRFLAWDPDHHVALSDHLSIHTLELAKWRPPPSPGLAVPGLAVSGLAELERWMYFLKEGRNWRALPAELASPPLEEAMSVLNGFSEKKEDYLRYKARVNFLRDQAEFKEGLADALEQLRVERAAKEAERAAKESALADRDAAITREASLRARLRAAGLDPDVG